jgi:hypothetical protein
VNLLNKPEKYGNAVGWIPIIGRQSRILKKQKGERGMSDMEQTEKEEKMVTDTEQVAEAGSPHPLYGVKGWLKFFVVVNLYVAPVIFVLRIVLSWVGFSILAENYPRIILVGVVETLVGGLFVVKFIQIARRLRDIRPGVVQEAKAWLKVILVWSIVDAPFAFISGMDADALLPGAIKGIVTTAIAFAIWHTYFSVSKRVKATFPDWNY